MRHSPAAPATAAAAPGASRAGGRCIRRRRPTRRGRADTSTCCVPFAHFFRTHRHGLQGPATTPPSASNGGQPATTSARRRTASWRASTTPTSAEEPDADLEDARDQRARDVLSDREEAPPCTTSSPTTSARGAGPDGSFRPPPGWDEGFEFRAARAPRGRPTMPTSAEFFSSIFGNAESRRHGRRAWGGGARGPAYREKGEDHHAAIEISLEDALNGAQRRVALRPQVIDEQGRPHFETRTLDVQGRPACGRAGSSASAGKAFGHGGEPAGDLYLEVLFPAFLSATAHQARRPLHDAARDAHRSRARRLEASGADARRRASRRRRHWGGRAAAWSCASRSVDCPASRPATSTCCSRIAPSPANTDAARAYEQLAKAARLSSRANISRRLTMWATRLRGDRRRCRDR